MTIDNPETWSTGTWVCWTLWCGFWLVMIARELVKPK